MDPTMPKQVSRLLGHSSTVSPDTLPDWATARLTALLGESEGLGALDTTPEGVEVESNVKLVMAWSELSSSLAPLGTREHLTCEMILLLVRAASGGVVVVSKLSRCLLECDITGAQVFVRRLAAKSAS